MLALGLSLLPFAPFALVGLLPSFNAMIGPDLVAMLGALALALASVRLSLALPALAVDQPLDLRAVWHLSDRQGLDLLAVLCAPALLFWGIDELAMWLMGGWRPPGAWLFGAAYDCVVLVLELSVLSITYRALRGSAPA